MTLRSPRTASRTSGGADALLVVRAQGGDRAAFAELYQRHAPAVARLAHARAATSDVDDAVAETFSRAWRSIGRYRDTGAPFVSWLYGIGRNVIADGHRKRQRVEITAEFDDRAVDDTTASTLDLIELGAALGKLNKRHRRVVELKYLAGLDNAAVAAALGITEGAVNTLQWRALQRLKTLLEEGR